MIQSKSMDQVCHPLSLIDWYRLWIMKEVAGSGAFTTPRARVDHTPMPSSAHHGGEPTIPWF